jgi:hypothetical protein
MTMSRRTHRLVTVSASVALLSLIPGLTAVASANVADSAPASDDESAASRSVVSDSQAAAVKTARADYLSAVSDARTTLRTALDAIWASVKADISVQRDGAATAEDAYRAAMDASGASYQAQADAARALARTAIDAAAATYVTTVTGIFAGQPVPEGLLDAPSVKHRHWASTDHNSMMGNAYGRPDFLGSGPGNSDFGRSGGNGRHSSNGNRGSEHGNHALGHSMIR